MAVLTGAVGYAPHMTIADHWELRAASHVDTASSIVWTLHGGESERLREHWNA